MTPTRPYESIAAQLWRDHPEEMQAARDRYASLVRSVCAFGNCTVLVDSSGRNAGGAGPVGCACEKRWTQWPDQTYKPAFPAKVRGRHGSRVARSRRRHADIGPDGIENWVRNLFADEVAD